MVHLQASSTNTSSCSLSSRSAQFMCVRVCVTPCGCTCCEQPQHFYGVWNRKSSTFNVLKTQVQEFLHWMLKCNDGTWWNLTLLCHSVCADCVNQASVLVWSDVSSTNWSCPLIRCLQPLTKVSVVAAEMPGTSSDSKAQVKPPQDWSPGESSPSPSPPPPLPSPPSPWPRDVESPPASGSQVWLSWQQPHSSVGTNTT